MSEQYNGAERRHLDRTPLVELSYQRFGAPTYVQPHSYTVNSVEAEVIPANPNRVGILIVNNSDSIVWANFEPGVSSDYGFPIGANGGSVYLDFESYGQSLSMPFHMVSSGDSKLITAIETLLAEA